METSDSPFMVLDSSFLVALYKLDDQTHGKARKVARSLAEKILILPNEVFSETVNTIWKKVGKEEAVKAATEIINEEPSYLFAQTTREIRQLALLKFEKQKRSVSFTDCLVMAFADAFKTRRILGFDEAFAQNGYVTR